MAISTTDQTRLDISSLRCAAGTDVGMRRDENQDSFGVIRGAGFVAYFVADGMGGAQGGAVASRMAISALQEALVRPDFRVAPATITEVITHTNARIYEKGTSDPAFAGMGTTLVGLVFTPDALIVVNVGDSRAYRVRDRSIVQLSEDHTLVRDLVRTGALTPEEAEHHPVSHMLTRSLGPVASVQVDCTVVPGGAQFGDTYVLCSDGLYNLVPQTDILAVVSQNPIDDANQVLINLANQRGGADNITALVISVGERAARSRVASGEFSIRRAEVQTEAAVVEPVREEPTSDGAVIPPAVQEPPDRRSLRKENRDLDGLTSYRPSRIPTILVLGLTLGIGLFIGDIARRLVPATPPASRGGEAPQEQGASDASTGQRAAEASLQQTLRTREEIMESLKELNKRIESLAGEVSARGVGKTPSAQQESEKRLKTLKESLAVASKEEQLWKARKTKLAAGKAADIEDERKKVAAYSDRAQEQLAHLTDLSLEYLRAVDERAVRPNDEALSEELERLAQERANIQIEFEAEVLRIASLKYQESSSEVAAITKAIAQLQAGSPAGSRAKGAPSDGSQEDSNGEKPLQAILDDVSPRESDG